VCARLGALRGDLHRGVAQGDDHARRARRGRAPLVGFIVGVDALGGLLAGALVTGFALAIFMANSGGAWDNAKKYIEAGNHGGKGSDPHKAAVVGDTVGDPFKDTSGPAMNILIKVMSVVALVIAPLIAVAPSTAESSIEAPPPAVAAADADDAD
jgi:hypothetical protein